MKFETGLAPRHEPKALDTSAYGWMLLLAALFGFQQVAIKLVASDVPPLTQGAIRSVGATVMLLLWAWMRGVALFKRDGTLGAGLLVGLLFGGEFVFIYAGLAYTSASRMVIFLYLTPVMTAVALHYYVPGERLQSVQWAGVLVAFSGIVLAFSDGLSSSRGMLVGDLCGAAAAILWSAQTIVIRRTVLARTTATRIFVYQITLSAAMLCLASVLTGGDSTVLTPLAGASLGYQIMVAFGGYLASVWLLTKYKAGPLSILTFMTPLFGVLGGVVVLSEPLRPGFAIAVGMVAAGILLASLRFGGSRSRAG